MDYKPCFDKFKNSEILMNKNNQDGHNCNNVFDYKG